MSIFRLHQYSCLAKEVTANSLEGMRSMERNSKRLHKALMGLNVVILRVIGSLGGESIKPED